MASYTITLRSIVKNGFDVFGSFPCRDGYKDEVKEKIIQKYNDYEIAFESVGLFKDKLNARLNLIMPNYNKLFEAYEIEFNLMYNVHMEETFTQKSDGSSTGKNENVIESSNSTTTDTRQSTSDFPDSKLVENDILSQDYISSGQLGYEKMIDGGESTNTTSTTNSNEENVEWTRVQDGSSAGMPFSKAFKQYREDYLFNIYEAINNDLSDLFIQVW